MRPQKHYHSSVGAVVVTPLRPGVYSVSWGAKLLGCVSRAGRYWYAARTAAPHFHRRDAIEALISKARPIAGAALQSTMANLCRPAR